MEMVAKMGAQSKAGGMVIGRGRDYSYCIGEKSRMGADTSRVPM